MLLSKHKQVDNSSSVYYLKPEIANWLFLSGQVIAPVASYSYMWLNTFDSVFYTAAELYHIFNERNFLVSYASLQITHNLRNTILVKYGNYFTLINSN